jgi:putative spermidine/putrescine transport system permease protein
MNDSETRSALLPVAPAALFLTIIFAMPVGVMLLKSITDPTLGPQNFFKLIESSVYIGALSNTVIVSASVTALCVLLGYPMAYLMAHSSERIRRILIFIVLVPFWSSILVRTFAWMVLLQNKGLINSVLINIGIIDYPLRLIYNRTGVLIGMVHILLPFLILPLYSVLTRIDESYTSAASSLGASPVKNFLRVYLPLSLPGIASGAVLVFVMGLGYYITPALLGGPKDLMIAQLIEMQIADFGNWGLAGALAVILLAGSLLTLAFIRKSLFGGSFS